MFGKNDIVSTPNGTLILIICVSNYNYICKLYNTNNSNFMSISVDNINENCKLSKKHTRNYKINNILYE